MSTIISYWNQNATYSTELDMLFEKLVPSEGEADTLEGNLIRAVTRLGYEYSNNGNCNARSYRQEEERVEYEVYDEEAEEYYTEYDVEYIEVVDGVSDFYMDFIQLIGDNVPTVTEAELNAICEVIMNEHPQFNQKEYDVYNVVIDKVVENVLTRLSEKGEK